ncbi:MAG: DUF4143 domain-containing protein [Clostridiales Family XIII bacterium]|nr:DUF4143 domain-containing protein [Clostridiales Family XIII bacterium]
MDIDGIASDLSLEGLVFAACRGGWPSSLNKRTKKAKLYEAQNYVANICDSDASTVDSVKRSPERVKAVLQSYARNISTLATDKTILEDVSSNYMDISESTLFSYLNALERLYVIEDVPAWGPAIRSATAMRAGKKKGIHGSVYCSGCIHVVTRRAFAGFEYFWVHFRMSLHQGS